MSGTIHVYSLSLRGNGGAPMPTSKVYWQHAEQCLELAKEAEDFYVKSALTELAEEFKKQAEKIKTVEPAHSGDRAHSFRRIATTRSDRSRPV
jgi:hypothetical protein